MSSGIGVNIDQLTTVYSDGLPNYKSAAESYADGAATASSCQNFFFNADIEKYLTNVQEMNNYIMLLAGESGVLDTGYTTFAGKIAYLLVTLSEIEGKIDLSDYKDLAAMIEQIKGMSKSERNNFDTNNLANYSGMVNQLETLKKTMAEAMESISYEEVLKQLGYSKEDIDKLIESLGGEGIDQSNFNKKMFVNVMIFLASAMYTKDIPSSLGDLHWTSTDNTLWGAGTLLGKICEKYISGSYGGIIASLTIGSIIALTGAAEGESIDSVLSTFFEEGVAAACGAAVTGACTSALTSAGAFAYIASIAGAIGGAAGVAIGVVGTGGLLLAATAAGIVVTTVTGKIFHGISYYPGDIPKEFHTWDEAAQRKYIEDELGFDMDRVNAVDKLIDSGAINSEEASTLIKYCSDKDSLFGNGESYGSPEAAALQYYLLNKGAIDSGSYYYGIEDFCITAGVTELGEVYKYIDIYKSVLGEAPAV